jgi:hypothetical protein
LHRDRHHHARADVAQHLPAALQRIYCGGPGPLVRNTRYAYNS